MLKPPAPNKKYAPNLERAQEILGYQFKEPGYLEVALTHPSASQSHKGYNYERLEFLGDSVLGFVVAEKVYELFDDLDEGGLTRIKVYLVSGSMLTKMADQVGLGECIIFGDSEYGTKGRGMSSALENVFEACVAALYLDGGLEVARRWALSILEPHISKDVAKEPESPKSSLQEYLQARRRKPGYDIIAVDGPPHERVFTAVAMADDQVIGTGTGHSKKAAEAAAASAALKELGVL